MLSWGWRGFTMPDTAFFRQEMFDILRQLNGHRKREWFAQNKRRYEAAVR